MQKRYRIRIPALVLLVPVWLAAGCGSPATGTVAGTVTVGGAPVQNGLITFSSEVGNRDSFSAAILDGKYTTSAIPVGPTKVTVTNRGANPADAPAKESGANDNIRPTASKQGGKKVVIVPAKYGDVGTSGLTYDVTNGENAKDFDLTP